MNDPALPRPVGMRPELIAAYVDGELTPAVHAAVERWLAAHPEARELVADQHRFSPANWPLWSRTEAPRLNETTWTAMTDRIADAIQNHQARWAEPESPIRAHRRTASWLVGSLAFVAAAIAVAWVLFPPRNSPRPLPTASPASDMAQHTPGLIPAEVEPSLPLASADDVEILRVATVDPNAFLVGVVPLEGALVLAGGDDVAVEGVEEHPHWPTGGPVVVPNPGDAPMIYISRPR